MRRRDQDVFFHADVPQQPAPKFFICAGAADAGVRFGKRGQILHPPVILDRHLIYEALHTIPSDLKFRFSDLFPVGFVPTLFYGSKCDGLSLGSS
jgi:hypothetical protein